MSRRYRLVMRAYPADYRARRGDEVLDTACQLTKGCWSLRQALSLLWGGLGSRGRAACGNGGVALFAAGVRIGLLLMVAQGVVSAVVFELGATGDVTELSGAGTAWPLMAVVVAMVFTTRWPTAVLMTAAWLWVGGSTWTDHQVGLTAMAVSVTVLLTAMAWWLALATDGRRAASPRSLALGLMAAVGVSLVANDPGLLVVSSVTFGGLLLVGLVIVAVDPRLLIAASTMWLLNAVSLTALAATPGNRALWMDASLPIGVTIIGLTASALSTRRLTAPSVAS